MQSRALLILGTALLLNTQAFANHLVQGAVIEAGGTLEQGEGDGFTANFLVAHNQAFKLAIWRTGELCVYHVDPLTGHLECRWSSFKTHGPDYATRWAKADATFSLKVGSRGDIGIFATLPHSVPVQVLSLHPGTKANAGAQFLLNDEGYMCLQIPLG